MKRGAPTETTSESHKKIKASEEIDWIPGDVWLAVLSHCSFSHLGTAAQVSKQWLELTQCFSRQWLQSYFPHLKTTPDFQSAPIKLLVKKYQEYPHLFSALPMEIFSTACQNEDLTTILPILAERNISDAAELDLIRYIAENGYDLALGAFLDNTSVPVSDRGLALVTAAQYNRTTAMSLLLTENLPLEGYAGLALLYAARKGYLDVAKLILTSPLTKTKEDLTSALLYATSSGYLSIVKALLDTTVDYGHHKGIALDQAAENGHDAIVKLLLDRLTIPNEYKHRAIVTAQKKNHTKVIDVINAHLFPPATQITFAFKKEQSASSDSSDEQNANENDERSSLSLNHS